MAGQDRLRPTEHGRCRTRAEGIIFFKKSDGRRGSASADGTWMASTLSGGGWEKEKKTKEEEEEKQIYI